MAFEPRDQAILIDPVEERFQVEIDHPAAAVPDIRLQLAHGFMGRALRAKTVAPRVEVGFPLRRYDLRDGLLNESVQYAGHPEQPHALALGSVGTVRLSVL